MNECRVIVVPHVCVVSEKLDPNCDLRALEFAKVIAKSMPNSILFKGDKPRFEIDLNRRDGRQVGMRLSLTDKLFECRNDRYMIVIDVHTFPTGAFEEFLEVDVLLLYEDNWNFISSIFRSLRENTNLNVIISPGDGKNDVLIQAKELNIRAVLIEMRNTLNIREVEKIASILASEV